jgi:hypothetical protein
VGLVIAVDGRNIISGKQSWLRNDERMYILGPYGRGEFKGWRTSLDSINRFYFTEVADSYAAAFRDESAMGVIAVAVYPESNARTADPAPQWIGTARRARGEIRGRKRRHWLRRQEHSRADGGVRARSVAAEGSSSEWRSTLCRQGSSAVNRAARRATASGRRHCPAASRQIDS